MIRRSVIALLLVITVLCVAPLASSSKASAFDPFGILCSNSKGQGAVCEESGKGGTNPLTGPNGLLLKIANIIAALTGLVAIIVIIVAGWRYITSAGEAAKVQSAKSALTFAIIGLIVVVLADSIISLILSRL